MTQARTPGEARKPKGTPFTVHPGDVVRVTGTFEVDRRVRITPLEPQVVVEEKGEPNERAS